MSLPRRALVQILSIGLSGGLVGGCLAVESYEIHLRIDPTTGAARATHILRHLESDGGTPEAQESDFDDVVKRATGDDMLLESLEDGTYVRNRRLYVEDGVLNWEFEALLGRDWASKSPPDLAGPCIADTLDVEDGDDKLVDTNGTIATVFELVEAAQGADSLAAGPWIRERRILTWPPGLAERWVRYREASFHGGVRFVPLFREWEHRQGR